MSGKSNKEFLLILIGLILFSYFLLTALEVDRGFFGAAIIKKSAVSEELNQAKIETNPKSQQFPQNIFQIIRNFIIGRETKEGIVSLIHMDDFDNPKNSRYVYMLQASDNQWYELENARLFSIKPGSRIRVTGQIRDKIFSIDSGGIVVIDDGEIPGPEFNLGENRTLVILGEYGDRPFSYPLNEVQQAFFDQDFSIDDFYRENSGNKSWFTTDVIGPLNLGPNAPGDCDLGVITNAFMTAADPLVNFTTYKRVMFVGDFYCYGGLAQVGPGNQTTPDGDVFQTWSWEAYINLTFFVGVSAHELGHNFGTWHSNFANCGENYFGDGFGGCQNEEYGNLYAVMGYGLWPPRHFTANHKHQIGLFDANDFITATSGIYTLNPVESTGGIREIIIPYGMMYNDPFWGFGPQRVHYSLEYRQPLGYDMYGSWGGKRDGVFLEATGRLDSEGATWFGGLEVLVDSNPGPNSPWLPQLQMDAVLLSGEGFHDNNIGQSINVLSANSSGAQIQLVKDPAGCRKAFPDLTIESQSPPGIITPGTLVSYVARVTNNDFAECGLSHFDVKVESLPAWFVEPSSAEITLNPQQSTLFSFQIRSPSNVNLPNGENVYNISVTNSEHFYYKTILSNNYDTQLITDQSTTFLLHGNTYYADYARGAPNPTIMSEIDIVSALIEGGLNINSNTDHLRYDTRSGNFNWEKGTVEFWIKPNWSTSSQSIYTFFNIKDPPSGNGFTIGRWYDGPPRNLGGYIYFKMEDSTGRKCFEVNSVESQASKKEPYVSQRWLPGTWHQIAVSWNASTTQMSLYVDGELVHSKTVGTSCSGGNIAPEFRIGNSFAQTSQMDAVIDELRISDIQRTSTEIMTDYALGLAAQGPYCYWNNQIAKPPGACIAQGSVPYYCNANAVVVQNCNICNGCGAGQYCYTPTGTCKQGAKQPPITH